MIDRSPTNATPADPSVQSVRIGPRLPLQTINDLLAVPFLNAADAPAVLAPDRAPLTFAGLGRMMQSITAALASGGYGRGARIAVALPTGPECAVAVLAVSGCATCAPINPELDEQTLHHLLRAMRIDAMIVPGGERSRAVRAAERVDVATLRMEVSRDARAGEFALSIDARHAAIAIEPPRLHDLALISHTSGTTSLPKIVPFTQHGVAEATRAHVDARGITGRDRVLLMAPLYNIAGLRRSLLPVLMVGGSAVCPPGLDPVHFVAWLDLFRPTHYFGAAAQHIAILEILENHPAPIRHCLRFVLSGAATLPSTVADRLELILGVPVLEGYGMTEAGIIAQAPRLPARSPRGSVGLPCNSEVAIMDDEGRRLPTGEIGEIVVRGPEVFDGYENNPQANATAFRDGWFRTGDLGRIDRDGYVFIAGRLKDVINRGGSKVAPSVVEEALMLHAQVLEAAAYALPHATLGEDVAAAVVLRRDSDVTEQALREFTRAHLAAFQVPTRVIAVPALPRGALGKVKRSELAAFAARHDPTRYVGARDSEEDLVLRVFAEVLGLEGIGVADNFFQLGGDSLNGVRALARIESSCRVALPLDALFREPTAAGLAAQLRAARDPKNNIPARIDNRVRRRASSAGPRPAAPNGLPRE